VTFEAPLTLPEMHGTVLNSLQQPVAGMQVQATTVATTESSPSVISTTTTTDASGAFSIRLVASPPDKVMLTATPTNATTGPLPTLTRIVDTTKLGPTNALTAGLTVPPLPASVEVNYNIVGFIVTSGATMPVTSATCTFSADVSDPHATDGTIATYQTSATANPLTGQVTARPHPGRIGEPHLPGGGRARPNPTIRDDVDDGGGRAGRGRGLVWSRPRAQAAGRSSRDGCSAPTVSRCRT